MLAFAERKTVSPANACRRRLRPRWRPVTLTFFVNDTATTEIYTLSLHDALPIFSAGAVEVQRLGPAAYDRDLRNVVRRGLGGERPEQGQGHVHAVEAVDVVLAAASGARSTRLVLRVLHARDQLLQVA